MDIRDLTICDMCGFTTGNVFGMCQQSLRLYEDASFFKPREFNIFILYYLLEQGPPVICLALGSVIERKMCLLFKLHYTTLISSFSPESG